MRDFLGLVAFVFGLGAAVFAAAMAVEWFRQRSTRNWAESIGGTFESGGWLSGASVPEGAAFDEGIPEDAYSYRNVVRAKRRGATYVVATYTRSSTFGGKSKSHSSAVILVKCPDEAFPSIRVTPLRSAERPKFVEWAGLSRDPPPPDFADVDERFDVRLLPGAERPPAEVVANLLSRRVRDRLLVPDDLVENATFRGDTVRIEAIERQATYPYEELLALAESLVSEWRR